MTAPQIIVGPPTSSVTREEAESKLVANPNFPKNASYSLESVEGRWIAAITAGEPPAFLDGGGAGDTPDGPPSPDEEPKAPPTDDLDPEDSEKPKKDKDEKGSLEEQVAHLTELLTTVVDALGLGGHDDSPVPGMDDMGPKPPEGGPEGGPDEGPELGSGDNKNHVVHERALKPGEAPPGTTPIGSPSFASTNPDHPWASIIGQKKTFTVEEPIGDTKLAHVNEELKQLAEGTGYRVAQLVEGNAEGHRTARALITKI